MERLEERYLKWVLGVEGKIPGYLREELQRGQLRVRTGMKIRGYEKRLKQERESELARRCWKDWKERARVGKVGSSWEEQREEFFRSRGWGLEEVERKRQEQKKCFEEVVNADIERQRVEKWGRIKESRYNR